MKMRLLIEGYDDSPGASLPLIAIIQKIMDAGFKIQVVETKVNG